MVFLRFVAIGFLGLTILYLLLTITLRDRQRKRLERAHPRDHAAVELGMAAYQRKLRRWLPIVVYAIPVVGVAAFVYWMNNT